MKFKLLLFFCVASTWAKKPVGTRIIGGSEARAGQFPFIAAIDVETSNSRFFCGGALISPLWVLTAAHCIYEAIVLNLRLGSNSIIEPNDPNRVTVASSDAFPHPDFNSVTQENDIGLIRLRMPIMFSEYTQPIRMATMELSSTAETTALGWGQTSDDDDKLAEELNYVELAVISNINCRVVYGSQITDNMVCVEGNYNEGTCIGDSGTPLVVRPTGESYYEHVGVSIFVSGNGCESTNPSGYTRTYPYVGWIKNVTGLA